MARKNNNLFDKPDHAQWEGNPRDVKRIRPAEFYEYEPPKRFSLLFLGRLLPLYIAVYAAILIGVSIHHHGLLFFTGILVDPQLYLDSWLIFSWVLTPTLLWMGIAGTISFRDYAESWYIWSAIILAFSLGLCWLLMPEWQNWIRLHFIVSVFCHILLYFQLGIQPYPSYILKPLYGLGVIVIGLNLACLILNL